MISEYVNLGGTEPTEEWEEVRIEEPGASEPAA